MGPSPAHRGQPVSQVAYAAGYATPSAFLAAVRRTVARGRHLKWRPGVTAQRKADQLNAVIVAEFIEPGESGKTARRKALQEMLDYLAEHPVRYCIINKVERIARNRLDDAIIHATLRQAVVTLVSVMENIDETPRGCSCTASRPPSPSSTV